MPMDTKQAQRIQTSVLNAAERKLLIWLAERQPSWMTSDILTLIGTVGAAITGLGFMLSDLDIRWLWLSSFGLLVNWFSRKAEYRADEQAVKEGYGEALIEGLKKLSKENLADLSPNPLLVKLTYSHPTLSQRITAIEKLSKEQKTTD